jgi:UDP-2,4-diacetamido-2,4,6-trideoxy-beta-L-altropyranose hydrolase
MIMHDMRLLIRADANAQMGTGHIMRCLALAQAWQDARGEVTFALALRAAALEDRLRADKMSVRSLAVSPGSLEDADQTARLAKQLAASWVVLDGYHFGASYQRFLKDAGLRLLLVDDIGGADHYFADIILNQNLHAHPGLYPSKEPGTQLLLGTDYVLLRREFLKWHGSPRQIPAIARRILITLGGGDADNITLKVIKALSYLEVENLEALAVIGGSNLHYPELQQATATADYSIRLVQNVTDMPELMAWADVAVSAGGSTCWELVFMGLPAVVFILAANQRPVAQALNKEMVAINLGSPTSHSLETISQALTRLISDSRSREKISLKGHKLVDGQGVQRILNILATFS